MAAAKKAAKKAPAKKVARRPTAPTEQARPKSTGTTRVKLKTEDGGAASTYFTSTKEELGFISAGAELIDCALGGGWAGGRVVNIVGDRSAGKTLLAIEACANFHIKYGTKGHIRYAESEAAFDQGYAEALGMPVDAVEYNSDEPLRTIEDWYADMMRVMEGHKDQPILYIIDSLDALSDDAELEREITDNTYGANKAKKLGELFRRLVQQMEAQDCTLIVVSQLRDKIGVTFGETKTRSGGKALEYYASHIVWLSEVGKIKKTIDGVERIVGADIRMRVKKNKVGLPFRECNYPVVFGYGIDDITAGVEWLLEVKADQVLADELGMSKAGYKVRINNLRNKGGTEMREMRQKLNAVLRREWNAIETKFLPQSRKY